MSQSLISSDVAGRPNSAANAGVIMPATKTAAPNILRQDIANHPCAVDAPGLLRVVVKQRVGSHLRDEGRAVGLDVSLLVRGAADDLGRLAAPYPVDLESCLRFRQRRPVQARFSPGSGAIGADLHLADLPVTAPGQPCHAIIAGLDLHRSGRRGDDGVRLHPELELTCLAARE